MNNLVFFFVSSGGARLSALGTSAINWPIVLVPDDRWWVWSSWWNENWQGKPKYSEKSRPSATLFTTNPTWLDLGSNPGRGRLTTWAMARLIYEYLHRVNSPLTPCSPTLSTYSLPRTSSSLSMPAFYGAYSCITFFCSPSSPLSFSRQKWPLNITNPPRDPQSCASRALYFRTKGQQFQKDKKKLHICIDFHIYSRIVSTG
jgi:hypothetical protein